MEKIQFYHPEDGREIKASLVVVTCSTSSCEEYNVSDTVWDVGTGVVCGMCGSELLPASAEGMVYVDGGK